MFECYKIKKLFRFHAFWQPRVQINYFTRNLSFRFKRFLLRYKKIATKVTFHIQAENYHQYTYIHLERFKQCHIIALMIEEKNMFKMFQFSKLSGEACPPPPRQL